MSAEDREDGFGRRLSRFARVSAGLTGVAARGAGRALTGTRVVSAKNAADLTAVLGNLRGPVMKLAQFVATVPGVLPQEVAAPLLTLQTNAPPMGPGFVRRRMTAELGADWEKKFRSFDRQAAAAASLGQVHRATAKDGRLLACKLQYPDMGAAVDADVRQLKTALRLQRGFDGTIDTREIGMEIAARLAEELDYEREAAHMKLYTIMLADREDISVPEPVAPLSTKRLLTMTWLEGRPILDCADAKLEARNRIVGGAVQGMVAAICALRRDPWRSAPGQLHRARRRRHQSLGLWLRENILAGFRRGRDRALSGAAEKRRCARHEILRRLGLRQIVAGAGARFSTCGRASSSIRCSTIACR